jgi:YVTN family beta-propeller protein
MSCNKSLTLSQTINDQAMDSACYVPAPSNLIIGVRGSRVFQCDPTTGAILQTLDYQQLGLGPATIVYAASISRCFAACFNTCHTDFANFRSDRVLTRIIPGTTPGTMVVDQVTSINTLFSGDTFQIPGNNTSIQEGIVSMVVGGANIYALAYFGNTNPTSHFLKFTPNLAVHSAAIVGGTGGQSASASICYANQAGDDVIVGAFPAIGNFLSYDFTSLSNGGSGGSFDVNAVEYAPTQDKFFCPEEFQFINVFDGTGTFLVQLNTGRSTFNGVNIRRNSNDGLLYVAGGKDNTVVVINPATNAITIKSGFDLPWDFVFTPTKKWAVQQGSIALREIT